MNKFEKECNKAGKKYIEYKYKLLRDMPEILLNKNWKYIEKYEEKYIDSLFKALVEEMKNKRGKNDI